ncbi:unnamed protein product, partial [Closterium sp. NIES-54]
MYFKASSKIGPRSNLNIQAWSYFCPYVIRTAAAALGASASGTTPGTAPAEALHTFTLDSGASRCFFRDSTTLTPLPAPVPVTLADPSGGPIVARSSTVLPCPAVSSGSLSGLHLPSFSTNLVSTAALQDAMVTTTTPGGQRVSICTCTRTGCHLATFTRRPGSSMYTLATEPPQVAASAQVSASGQVAASCSCRLLLHRTLLWHHRLGHPRALSWRRWSWQTNMDAEMAYWKSTCTYVDAVLPPRANIVNGMWIFRVKRPPGSPPVFKARYVARGFSQRQGVDFFQTFSPTPKMTTLRVLLHVAAHCDYELHSLDFSTAFLQGSLHEEIWLRRPHGFTGSFPAGTQFSPSTADPSLFRTDTSLPPFYVLVYVNDLVFATADTEALALVKSELQKRHSYTELAPPSDESVEPSGPYPELVGCLIPRVALCCSAPHALLQSARPALLPCASSATAASASRSAALRVAPCCSQRIAPCCSQRIAPCCSQRIAPCCPARAAGSAGSAGGAGGATGSAGGAAGAGRASGSAGGAAGAGGAGPTTDRHCLSWPLSRQLQRLGVDSGCHCLSRTTPPLSSFVSGFFSKPVQVVEALVFYLLRRGGSRAAALGASESAATLGASESAAALGASESAAALGARASPATGLSSAEALHTFTLDSGASRCFFCDYTALTPLAAPVLVSLVDPAGGPVVARASIVLPCLAVPSGSQSSLHLPMFSTNLVSNAAIQDVWVDTFIHGGQRVAICTCSRTGRHLATFTGRHGSSLYTLTTVFSQVAEAGQVAASSQVSASGQLAASCSCWVLSHQTLLWHHRLGHPSLPHLRGMHSHLLVSGLPRSLPSLPRSPVPPCLPCVEGRQRAAPQSSEFTLTTAPLQTLHMDGPAPSGVSQVDPPFLVEPLEVSSESSEPAKGGDPVADKTAATCSSPCLETPPGFPPRLSLPPPQPAAVDSGAETAGYCPTGAGAASPGGTAGAGGTGGVAGAGGTRGGAGAGGSGATSPRGATCAGGAGPTSPGGTAATGGVGGAAGARGAGAGGTGGAGAAGHGGARTGGAGAAGAGGAVRVGGATVASGSGGTGGTAGARGAEAGDSGGTGGARATSTGGIAGAIRVGATLRLAFGLLSVCVHACVHGM